MTASNSRSSASAAHPGGGLDAILSFKNEDQDFYALLGCHSSSTVEQIQAEYKVRALKLHPDKNPGDSSAEHQFQLLQFAKETLCDAERRATYDKWRSSGLAVSFRDWLGMKDRVHTSMHWATPKTADRMLPAQAGGADESTSTAESARGKAAAVGRVHPLG
ncbi:J domain-containing protein-like [Pollicipes pollicipes]|uniref:J domain-containing protein-like n=1 Tax=Pollicipes pollicipes TaxID=41117 RepID=UPI0018859F62|nr:J domain-containing protein-like [Pollicipes pollicipes]XP_037084142.1 J domain-containing protein-like [Pollicipes pollicipes]XP_037084143.1 J domain-containing protein-like [Pollicipes pollicipes]